MLVALGVMLLGLTGMPAVAFGQTAHQAHRQHSKAPFHLLVKTSNRAVGRKGRVRIHGRVRPRAPHEPVLLQARLRRHWHTVARTRLSRHSSYGFAYRPRHPGTNLLRVLKPADRQHGAARSPILDLTLLVHKTTRSSGGAVGVRLGTVRVIAPKGSIAKGQTLTLTTAESSPTLGAESLAGGPYQVSTSQGEPRTPVKLSFRYDPGLLQKGDTPIVMHRSTAANGWVPLHTNVEPKRHIVSATLESFSLVDVAADRTGYSRRSSPCTAAFPDARSKTIGRTTWYNRQESMRMVVCYHFGLEPSADFPISASMVCSVLSQAIEVRSEGLSLFVDGACSGADLASDPSEPEKYVAAACDWASAVLGVVATPVAGGLGSLGCAIAPSVGHSLGGIWESGHELGVATDVVQHGRCIKYSPTHFGSPWLAVACARGDQGFSALPRVGQGGSGSNQGTGGGEGSLGGGSGGKTGGGSSGGGGSSSGSTGTTVYYSSAEGPYTGPPPETSEPESPLLSATGEYGCAIAVSRAVRCFGDLEPSSIPSSIPGAFQQVSAGWLGGCGVETTSALICWGRWGSTEPPPSGSFRSVSVGETYVCAIDTQYILTCWGTAGNAAPIPDPGRYTEVSTGDDYTCAIHTDGTLDCWGNGTAYYGAVHRPPSGTFREISVGGYEACGLTYFNDVTCWEATSDESRTHGGPFTEVGVEGGWACAREVSGAPSCFVPDETSGSSSSFAPRAGNYSGISLGHVGVCGRHEDGSVNCWGGAYSGQVTPASGTFISLMAGDFYTCGLRSDNSVSCWGNTDGESPTRLSGSFLQISGAGRLGNLPNLCGVALDHTLVCQGSTPPSGAFTEVAATEGDACAIRAGSGLVTCWSSLMYAGVAPPAVPPAGALSHISGGGDGPWSQYCGLRPDETVACWQPPESQGVLEMAAPPGGQFVKVSVGMVSVCGIRTDGSLSCWKPTSFLGLGSPPSGTFEDVAVGELAACAIRADGSIACWGQDEFGETDHPSGTFTQVVAGDHHMCALRSDGSVACWGHGDVLGPG